MKARPHPARFSEAVLRALQGIFVRDPVLDPFGGTGRLREVFPRAVCLELEREWAECNCQVQGNALALPFADHSFRTVITSPCYGNRMADHHDAKDGTVRHTYRHTLGRPLHPANAGQLQWGDEYRHFHRLAWAEVWRVLEPGGLFVLNVSDHIRAGRPQWVPEWHWEMLRTSGFRPIDEQHIKTPRQGHGQNGQARVPYEILFLFRREEVFGGSTQPRVRSGADAPGPSQD